MALYLKFLVLVTTISVPNFMLVSKGQVALEGNFRFGLDKSDLKSASDKKILSGKLQSHLRTKSVNKTQHHAVSAL